MAVHHGHNNCSGKPEVDLVNIFHRALEASRSRSLVTDEVLRCGKEPVEEVVELPCLRRSILQRSLGPEDFLENAPVGSPLSAVLHEADVEAKPSHPEEVSLVI